MASSLLWHRPHFLQEYAEFRFGPLGTAFLRLDGSTNRILRELDIRTFNAADSAVFLYLISTRAGGQGINLATANSVVLFDTAWNPQVDLQAEDRAHRIGQRRQVTVYRLVAADTVEEQILQTAQRKLLLDHVVLSKREPKSETLEEPVEEVPDAPGNCSGVVWCVWCGVECLVWCGVVYCIL